MRTLQSEMHESVPPELAPSFHNLHLPGGVQTAPHLPADLRGMRALDIGCNAGFYTFELARRGADVLAVDNDEHYLRQAR